MKNSKPFLSFLSVLIIFLSSCDDSNSSGNESSQEGAYSTANILCELSEEMYNSDESVNANSIYSWTSDDTSRILSGNGIPNHEVGTFPNPDCPNTISEQNINQIFA